MSLPKFFRKRTDHTPTWCILNDHLDEIKGSPESYKKAKELKLTTFWQCFDDDGILYYSGYCNEDNMSDIFRILDWCMAYSGCTELKVRNSKTGLMEIV